MSSKDDIFGGFEAIAGVLSKGQQEFDPNIGEKDFPIEDGPREDIEDEELEEIEEEEEESSKDEKDEDKEKKDSKVKDFVEQPSIKFKDKIDEEEEEDAKEDLEDSSEDDFEMREAEPEISAYVQEKLYDKFGWELSEDEKKFESIEDVVEFISKVVDENSEPEFANEDVAALNEFVSNGGDLKKYYEQIYSGVDLENIDLENEANQVLTIRESLSVQGHDGNKIGKRIERYRDTGILKEEAEEAAEFLKGYRKSKSEKLLQEQEKFQEETRKQQHKFLSDVQSYVNSLKDIKGISLSKADKNAILAYGLRPEADGKTKYQKEYTNSLVKNFVESVFFTMKGDKLITELDKKAGSKAAKDLKRKLEMRTKRIKGMEDEGSGGESSVDYSIFDKFSSQLSKPNF